MTAMNRTTANAAPKQQQWNQMEIHAIGSRIRVLLNGKQIQDADLGKMTLPDAMKTNALRTRGHIGLQCLGTTAEFRNIRIRELNKTP